MIRCLLVLFLGACVVRIHAQAPQRFEATAQISESTLEGDMHLKGNAQLRDRDALLTADEIRANHRTGHATATGNVVFTRGPLRLLAEKLVYQRDDQSFSAERVRVGSFPYYAEGDSAVGNGKAVTIYNAKATYGEPGPWQPTLKAERVVYEPGSQLSSENSQVGLGGVQPLPFPKFRQNLTAPFAAFMSLNGGYRSSLGVFAEAGLHLPLALGVRVGGELSGYSQRGIMFGPGAHYRSGDNGESYRGFFSSGYINDHGDRGTDLLGRPVPENRAYAEWQHQQKLSANLDLKAQLNWWKDSEVVRDFRPRKFFPVQQPDTFIESTYSGQNYLVSLFARFQPNSFQYVQERLPELRFDLLPTAIGGGLYQRFNASYARLRDRGPMRMPLPTAGGTGIVYGPNTTLERADRFDAYYAIERPIAPTNWLAITPVAGARVTHYGNTRASLPGGDFKRVFGEFGFDAALRASGVYQYRNPTWKIDGLRHLITPRLSYRYIDIDKASVPTGFSPIDRQTFSTYLQPLGLGDVRNIDDLGPTNTLRLSLDNILQTRDPKDGTRDLLMLNLASDFRFKRRRGEHDVSEIHAELAVMPTHWLQLDIYNSFRPQDFTLREFNTGLTLHDADVWSLRFSNNFLRGQLEDYFIDGRVRLNERFAALSRLHYDARKNRFNEQAYGLVQNLSNTWQISYVVSLYSGRKRESRFGFNVEIDALRF